MSKLYPFVVALFFFSLSSYASYICDFNRYSPGNFEDPSRWESYWKISHICFDEKLTELTIKWVDHTSTTLPITQVERVAGIPTMEKPIDRTKISFGTESELYLGYLDYYGGSMGCIFASHEDWEFQSQCGPIRVDEIR